MLDIDDTVESISDIWQDAVTASSAAEASRHWLEVVAFLNGMLLACAQLDAWMDDPEGVDDLCVLLQVAAARMLKCSEYRTGGNVIKFRG